MEMVVDSHSEFLEEAFEVEVDVEDDNKKISKKC